VQGRFSAFHPSARSVIMTTMDRGTLGRQPMAADARASALRVLVVSTDTHYHERVHAVIGELGSVSLAITQPTDAEAIDALATHEGARVVVLDATGCEATVAAVVAGLARSAPRLGVVVVCEHLTGAARTIEALPKWGWMRELRAAVERAQIDGSPLITPPAALLRGARRDLRGVGPGAIARR
jgi:NAD(P)-dependent dehydrogenase (short-subunit alcohol dehydrogenase family)